MGVSDGCHVDMLNGYEQFRQKRFDGNEEMKMKTIGSFVQAGRNTEQKRGGEHDESSKAVTPVLK